jgi:glutamyl-tRNA reductase
MYMLNGLKLWNFTAGTLPPEELCGSTFVLRTCQRTLVLTFERHPFQHQILPAHFLLSGQDAYLFLLETICGLKSKLIGENEIVGQFKEAYKIYAQSTLKDTRLLRILEKLFKDAKDIRTQYLIGISQKTYASLTRKHLIQKARATDIVILGSGVLAEDLINQFKKKAQISVCARNAGRVKELAQMHQLNILPWEERHNLVNKPFIANTIGHNSIILHDLFFREWANQHNHRLFVDLGSPSVISTSLTAHQGIIRLDDIFQEGAIVEEHKQQQITLARNAMLTITHKRKALFEEKILTPQMTADVRYL